MPYVKRTTIAGQTIEIEKYYSSRYGKGRNKRRENTNTTTEQQEKINFKQAVKKLRRLLNANFVDCDYHNTFTFSKDKRPKTVEEVKKIYNKLIRDLRKEYNRRGLVFKYVAVIEYGKSGENPHIHIILPKIDTRVFLKVWKYGKTGSQFLYSQSEAGQYGVLAEYLIKESEKTPSALRAFGKHWNASKNLVKPIEKVEIIKAKSFRKEPPEIKGYHIDKKSGIVENYIDDYGLLHQHYILVKDEPKHKQRR